MHVYIYHYNSYDISIMYFHSYQFDDEKEDNYVYLNFHEKLRVPERKY